MIPAYTPDNRLTVAKLWADWSTAQVKMSKKVLRDAKSDEEKKAAKEYLEFAISAENRLNKVYIAMLQCETMEEENVQA